MTAQAAAAAPEDLFELPLESLLNVEITSVSKREESVWEAPAAIYVITNDDIRRSGATTIPDALRLAPGLQVAQIDANKWAISARGFNGQLANKLLVLMDGRDIYTPLFSGVNWDEQDTLLEDIDRIEVIRGPGATLWGANAVNGVINIITKKARDTQGTLTAVNVGTKESLSGVLRHGGEIGEYGHYRVYSKGFERDNFTLANGNDARDSWHQERVGFRADFDNKEDDTFTVQGDAYTGQEDRLENLPLTSGTFAPTPTEYTGERRGGNILGRWNHSIDDDSKTSLQVYYDKVIRNNLTLKQNRNTFDVDFQHTLDFTDHEFIWGAGYRYANEHLTDSIYFDFSKDNRITDIYTGFLQDKYDIISDVWSVVLGTKFEHNDYTGFEIQPNIRTSWLVNDKNMLWASVSRAVRTPSRAEDDISLVVGSQQSVGLITQIGSENFQSEELIAYEVGYRVTPQPTLSFDFAAFYNDYTKLRTLEFSGLDLNAKNNGTAESAGFEASVNWEINDNWHITPNYTFIAIDTHVPSFISPGQETILDDNEGETPKNQLSLLSRYDIPSINVEVDNFLYFADNLPKSASNIGAFIRFDTRLGWRPFEGLELSLVGQNLFDDSHPEFDAPTFGTSTEVDRSVYARAKWQF